jgi:hypothetical protein
MPRSTFYSATDYGTVIKLTSGATLPELDIILRDSNIGVGGALPDPYDPTTWAPLDLSDVDIVHLNFRKKGATTSVAIPCSIVTPFADGHIIMRWREADLAGSSGDYEGEIEVTYNPTLHDDGTTFSDIANVYDILKFDVREGF